MFHCSWTTRTPLLDDHLSSLNIKLKKQKVHSNEWFLISSWTCMFEDLHSKWHKTLPGVIHSEHSLLVLLLTLKHRCQNTNNTYMFSFPSETNILIFTWELSKTFLVSHFPTCHCFVLFCFFPLQAHIPFLFPLFVGRQVTTPKFLYIKRSKIGNLLIGKAWYWGLCAKATVWKALFRKNIEIIHFTEWNSPEGAHKKAKAIPPTQSCLGVTSNEGQRTWKLYIWKRLSIPF